MFRFLTLLNLYGYLFILKNSYSKTETPVFNFKKAYHLKAQHIMFTHAHYIKYGLSTHYTQDSPFFLRQRLSQMWKNGSIVIDVPLEKRNL